MSHPSKKTAHKITMEEAYLRAEKTLKQYAPGQEFLIHSLRPIFDLRPNWVFLCENQNTQSKLIAKVCAPQKHEKLKAEFLAIKDTASKMNSGRFHTPKALDFNENDCAIFEYIEGQNFTEFIKEKMPLDDLKERMRDAFGWMKSYHSLSEKDAIFDPHKALEELTKIKSRHIARKIEIKNFAQFEAKLTNLSENAQKLSAQPCKSAIIHRDMHSGNLIYTDDNLVFGIDFSNTKHEPVFHDQASLGFDILFNAIASNYEAESLLSLMRAYFSNASSFDTPQPMQAFYLQYYALRRWAECREDDASSKSKHRLKSANWLCDFAENFD